MAGPFEQITPTTRKTRGRPKPSWRKAAAARWIISVYSVKDGF